MSAFPVLAVPGELGRVVRAYGAGLVMAVSSGGVQAADLTIVVKDAVGNTLEDAVVLAEALDTPPNGVIETSPRLPPATISQIDKQFEPYVSVIRRGTAVDFPNRDDILHNVYSFSKAKHFQLPLYRDKPPEPVVFDKPGVVILGCNIHDWMVAYILVADTPHFAKTGTDGRVVLRDVPPGSYLVRVWHPRKKRRGSSPERSVHLTSANPEPMEFAVALKPEWRPRRPPE